MLSLRLWLFPALPSDPRFCFGIFHQEKTSRKNLRVLYPAELQRRFRGNRLLNLEDRSGNFYRSADLFRSQSIAWSGRLAVHLLSAIRSTSTCHIVLFTGLAVKIKMCYFEFRMFTNKPCAAGCGRPAITGYNLCFVHLANPEREYLRICSYIEENNIIRDLTVSGMQFEDTDFSNHHFYGCNFKDTSFNKCNFSGMKIRMSFFDFSGFIKCDFTGTDSQFISFAGSNFHNCDFSNSELIHVNFEGTTIINSAFDNSNLYNSRFISADLTNITFIDCNLKRVYFASAKQNGVVFKASNTAEAVFETEEE